MIIFVNFGNPKVPNGIKFIQSSGKDLIPFETSPLTIQRELSMRVPTFPTDIVGSFIGGFIAPDVVLNTSVSSVGSPTTLPNANNQSSLQDKGKNVMFPTAGALPTPVLVEKLAF